MKTYLIFIISLLSVTAFGQTAKDIVTSNQNFYKIQKEVNAYFDKKYCDEPECKGDDSEYHKYKRWEWYWEQRVTNDGHMPNMSEVAQSIDAFKRNLQAKDSSTFENSIYNWSNITQTTSLSGYTGMGRATSMGFHPTKEDLFYVGAPNGGIWKTTDGGKSYENIGEDLPYVSVGNILVHPENPDTIYISVGDHTGWWNYGLGVYKTTDGGQTWGPTEFSHELHNTISILDMAMCPKNPDLIIVASAQGLYKTEDGFETVRRIRTGEYNSVKFNPQDSALVMVTHRRSEDSQVFRSDNAGATWGLALGFETEDSWVRRYIKFAPSDPSHVYVSSSDRKFYKSIDYGRTFEYMSDLESFGPLIVSGVDKEKVFCGFISIYETLDGGNTWDQKTNWYNNGVLPTVHADMRNSYNNPHNPAQEYVCNDGGIYLHDENTNQWTDLSDGLIIMQYYRMANAQNSNIVVIGGTQDNGGRKRNGFGNWSAVNGGDAMEVAIDPRDFNTIYTTYINGLLYRSRDFWTNDTYYCISCNIPGKEDDSAGSWVTPYQLDPNDPNTIVAGYERVWKSLNQGEDWFPISDTLYDGRDIDVLTVAPSNSNTIAVGIDNRYYLTNDGGVSWDLIEKPTGNNITSITFDPENEQRMWMTLSGYSPFYRVLYSEDQGSNWTNISYNLPLAPVTASAFLHSDQGELLLIGTDVGLFVLGEGDDAWGRYGENLPFTHVTDIEFQYNSKKIRISTYGRGLWEADMPRDPVNVNLIEQENDFHIFPNPVIDHLMVESQELGAEMIIFDTTGKKYRNFVVNNYQSKIDMSDLETGVYFMKSSEGGVVKFLKL